MIQNRRLLELALKGLEADRAKLDEEIADIKGQLGSRPGAANTAQVETATGPGRKRRRMSAEARRKISEAMKRRYAELRKALKK